MKKILVIEDELPVRENIIELLTEEKYDVIGASNGVEGVKAAWEHLPDLIICDILMPKLDGYSVLAILSRDKKTALIPFIFLTARTGRDDQRAGMELGADDYVTKPFTREELLNAIVVRMDKQDKMVDQIRRKLEGIRENVFQALPHELMEPLSLILGFSAALSQPEQAMDHDQVVNLANDIHTSAKHLLRLIQNYLLYAELERIGSDPQRLNAYLMADRSCETRAIVDIAWVVAEQENRQADFTCEIENALVALTEDVLQKIVEELLENAFLNTKPGCQVNISGKISPPNSYILTIVDAGQGMPVDQIADIVSTIQYDERLHENQDGNLNLILVKRLSELNQGQFNLDSEAGKGTTAKVILPLAKFPV